MVYIVIKDDSGFCVELEEDFDSTTVDCTYEVLQPQEIGMSIAYQLIGVEYCITDDVLENEIVAYLDDIMTKIKDTAERILGDNGVTVVR
jgi:hypothetical protein